MIFDDEPTNQQAAASTNERTPSNNEPTTSSDIPSMQARDVNGDNANWRSPNANFEDFTPFPVEKPSQGVQTSATELKRVRLIEPSRSSSSSFRPIELLAGSKSKQSLSKLKSPRSQSSRGVSDPYASAERLSHFFRSDGNLMQIPIDDTSIRSLNSQVSPVINRAHTSISSPFCRICFMGTEEAPLIRVCRCRGTVGLVHHHCLLLWNLQRQSYTCEICNHSYRLRVNGLRWCWNWIYPVPRSHIATQLLLFCMAWIVMVFSIASLIFIAFNIHTLFPDDVTAGVFIVMNSFTLLCSVGILLTQSLYPIRNMCHRFCMANLDVEILPYEESAVRQEIETVPLSESQLEVVDDEEVDDILEEVLMETQSQLNSTDSNEAMNEAKQEEIQADASLQYR